MVRVAGHILVANIMLDAGIEGVLAMKPEPRRKTLVLARRALADEGHDEAAGALEEYLEQTRRSRGGRPLAGELQAWRPAGCGEHASVVEVRVDHLTGPGGRVRRIVEADRVILERIAGSKA